MPSSPNKPRRSRHSAHNSADLAIRTLSSRSRTSSQGSISQSATSPGRTTDDAFGALIASQNQAEEAHGNLADELADILDEEDEADINLEKAPGLRQAVPSLDVGSESSPSFIDNQFQKRLDHDLETGLSTDQDDDDDDKAVANETSTELDVLLKGLDVVLKRIQATLQEDTGGSFVKLSQALKNLPAQSVVENGTSRLISAHLALSTHVANQTRTLQNLVHPLISPFMASPREEDIDELIPLITSLMAAVPSQEGQCLVALNLLQSITVDLSQNLTYLSDSIYMMRQNLSSAGRKLRTVTEMVAELKHEADAREDAMRWIEDGHCDRKLLDRQCRSVCGEVIGGFEEVCQDWRQRLLAGLTA